MNRFVPRELLDIGFNERHLTFRDFEMVCASKGIIWQFVDGSDEGCTFKRRGRPVIFLNRKLSGWMLLWVAWHELAHILLGHPLGVHFFAPGTEEKHECEANDISLCCVIPEPALQRILHADFFEECLYPVKLVEARLLTHQLREM